MNWRRALVLKLVTGLDRRLQVNGGTAGALISDRVDRRFDMAVDYLTWKKAVNFIKIETQLRFGTKKVSGYPYEWELDTTNICQLKCPLCHTGLGTVNRDKGVMHFDLYKKVIDEIKDYCMWLSLYSWGEPFLNKEIDKFIRYAHDSHIGTVTSSNLNKPLNPEMAERLVDSGLDSLIVSLDGTTQEVYEVYRVGGHLGRVLDNIKLISDTKARMGVKTPHVEWQFIVMKQNEHQIPEARRMAAELGVDDIVFKKVDFPHGEDDPELAEKWLPVNTREFTRDNPFDKPYKENGARCWRLWRSGVVNWDGGYAPCCYLTDAADDFGSVKTSSIKEIWNNQDYVTARGLFQENFEPQKYVGCMDCNVYQESKAAQKRGMLQFERSNGHKPAAAVPMVDDRVIARAELKAGVDERT